MQFTRSLPVTEAKRNAVGSQHQIHVKDRGDFLIRCVLIRPHENHGTSRPERCQINHDAVYGELGLKKYKTAPFKKRCGSRVYATRKISIGNAAVGGELEGGKIAEGFESIDKHAIRTSIIHESCRPNHTQ